VINLSNEIRELSLDELDAVIGAGSTTVSPNEQILAHFLSTHEHTTVGMSRYRFPPPHKPK
jgi:hypothetical protein